MLTKGLASLICIKYKKSSMPYRVANDGVQDKKASSKPTEELSVPHREIPSNGGRALPTSQEIAFDLAVFTLKQPLASRNMSP